MQSLNPMDRERQVLLSRENPRALGFPPERAPSISDNAMSNELVQKPSSSAILDRFRALLRDREDELKISDDDIVPPPSTDEIVRLYEVVLSELTFNSKPLITDLTILAGDQKEHGVGIADAICDRIVEVPVEHKLPSLYLLDSIVKNIGREYVRHFSTRLPEVFCEAYRQVDPNLYPAMRHLFGTWSTIFPQSVLRKIEVELQFSPRLNRQSPRPAHGIHVNPKYLEARHQFERSTVDSDESGTSSNLRIYAQKTANGYDEYDSDRSVVPSQIGVRQVNSSVGTGRTSFALAADKPFPSSNSRLARPSSPSRVAIPRSLSPLVNEFSLGNSPSKVIDRASPSHLGSDFGLGRMTSIDEKANELQRRHLSDDNHHRFDISVYNHSSGRDLQGPRALIDAYGNDRGKKFDKPQKVEPLDANGIKNKVATRTWQNTEEEEYDWEDMSPTLGDRGQRNDLGSSRVLPPRSFRSRPGVGPGRTALSELDLQRSKWSNQAQLPLRDNSSQFDEDSFMVPGSGCVSLKQSGSPNERNHILVSRYPLESWNMPKRLPRPSQYSHEGRGSRSGISSSASGKLSAVIDNISDSDAQIHWPSGLGSTNVEPFGVSSSTGLRPPANVNKSYPLLSLPNFPPKPIRSQFDLTNTSNAVINQGLHKPPYLPEHQLDSVENRALSSTQLQLLPNQHAASISSSQPNKQISHLPVLSQDTRENLVQPVASPARSHLAAPPLVHGYTSQGYGAPMNAVLFNQLPHLHSSLPMQNRPNSSLPPLPPGPPPSSSQVIPLSQGPVINNQAPGTVFPGLISSLMAQGLISLTTQAAAQDSVGVEFNPDVLKIRHESAIRALYFDLSRQCKTCGLRFKSQEEHSTHMDWHVTKNRVSKNRKQKSSRKWFVSTSMWLSTAEALGTDAVPGFLPTETVVEEKDDDEMAVPADENQSACALCGEPFDDFYSDDTDEWMYRGAVYMNAPSGVKEGMDGAHLGPIVHAKCRSESSAVSPDDFAPDEGGNSEEGRQRKRMRC